MVKRTLGVEPPPCPPAPARGPFPKLTAEEQAKIMRLVFAINKASNKVAVDRALCRKPLKTNGITKATTELKEYLKEL